MYPSYRPRLAFLLLAPLVAVSLSGCGSYGPRTVSRDRADYSREISESWKHQLLLNIVRLRYLDPPTFVEVGQIYGAYSVEGTIAAGGVAGDGNDFANFGVSGKYVDRPTIVYTPMTGSRYLRSLIQPLPPESIFQAIQNGTRADVVFLSALASINGLRNEDPASETTEGASPEFLRLTEILRTLQVSGHFGMRVRPGPDGETNLLTLRSEGIPPELATLAAEARTLLKLPPGLDEYSIVKGSLPASEAEIAVQTRSVLQIIQQLARRVEVPEDHVAEGRALPGATWKRGEDAGVEAGPRWRVRIRCSCSSPGDAFVSVRYRNHWFWIDDRDLTTKRAFSLIMMLFSLRQEPGEDKGPPVTVPLGG